jgi:hypothetical protein
MVAWSKSDTRKVAIFGIKPQERSVVNGPVKKTPSAPSERVVGLGGIAFGGGRPVGSSVRSFAFAAVATTVLKDGNEAAAGAHGRTEESRMAATGTEQTC